MLSFVQLFLTEFNFAVLLLLTFAVAETNFVAFHICWNKIDMISKNIDAFTLKLC